MIKVSINILTHNRAELLKKALLSVENQSFMDYEVVVVNDGSSDGTVEVLKNSKIKNLKIITHESSEGITKSRQEALQASQRKYIAVLDDDDEWLDPDKLKKQVEYFEKNPDTVLVGGGIDVEFRMQNAELRTRPETDRQIRNSMLFRNNFFTSTVMFSREAALKAGGFVFEGADFAEDYDLWLRIGHLGKLYNFPEVFAKYRQPIYNRDKVLAFFKKQLFLIGRNKSQYPYYFWAKMVLMLRIGFL